MKCQICKAPSLWSWQPFGPNESPLSFSVPGSHYRGFAVVRVCDECKARIESGKESMTFTHKGKSYRWDGSTVHWLREKRS